HPNRARDRDAQGRARLCRLLDLAHRCRLVTRPSGYLASAATCTRIIRSGSGTGSPFLIFSTASMPEGASPTTVYLPLRKSPSAYMMKNCELAEFGSFARAIPTMPRLNGTLENSAGRLG